MTCPKCNNQSEHDLRPQTALQESPAPTPTQSNATGEEDNGGCLIGLIIFGIVLAILFFTGSMFITTEGCTLPVDLVILDHCMGGTLGGSLGMTLFATIVIGGGLFLLQLVIRILIALFGRR